MEDTTPTGGEVNTLMANEIGAALIGILFGWLLARTVRKEGLNWTQFGNTDVAK